ncbi:MAG TPA: hypothetical protein VFE38_12840 [Edaphobacter sp.]|nr:hypothetical protein [Edaphobacter sp.]
MTIHNDVTKPHPAHVISTGAQRSGEITVFLLGVTTHDGPAQISAS